MTFKISDVVRLKSGGPGMTVTNVDFPDLPTCVWFDGNQERINGFPRDSLNLVDEVCSGVIVSPPGV